MLVGISGSRSLPAGAPVAPAVTALLRRSSVAVGCAVGADAAALAAAVGAGAVDRLRVFAAFGADGAGAWRGSAVAPVQAAAAAGGHVAWWAGGGPGVPLMGRLAQRSAAMVRAVASAGGGGGVVGFPAGACPAGCVPAAAWRSSGSGTWSTLALAAGLGLPVVVFPAGWSPGALPAWPGGSWACAGGGVWASAWRFTPAVQLSLF
jgi:hypothetical protein